MITDENEQREERHVIEIRLDDADDLWLGKELV